MVSTGTDRTGKHPSSRTARPAVTMVAASTLARDFWNFLTGDQKRTIPGFGKEVTAVRFVADTPNVVASCGDHGVYLKQADNGNAIRTYTGAGDFVFSVDVSADGKTLVAGSQDGVLRIWSEAGPLFAAFDLGSR